jgi:hypothetical protein
LSASADRYGKSELGADLLKLKTRSYHVDANRALTQRQLAIVVLGSRSRGMPQPVLTEGHFDVIDSRTRHLTFGYVS